MSLLLKPLTQSREIQVKVSTTENTQRGLHWKKTTDPRDMKAADREGECASVCVCSMANKRQRHRVHAVLTELTSRAE